MRKRLGVKALFVHVFGYVWRWVKHQKSIVSVAGSQSHVLLINFPVGSLISTTPQALWVWVFTPQSTPRKSNMEPETHPFEEENLSEPNLLDFWVQNAKFRGRDIKKLPCHIVMHNFTAG